MKAKVKWFNDSKGYGFVETESGKEAFVHYSEIQGPGFKTLTEDQEVEIDLYEEDKPKGKQYIARNVWKKV